MAPIALKECSDTEAGQQWNVQADGRIAVEQSPSPSMFQFFILSETFRRKHLEKNRNKRTLTQTAKTEQCIDLQYMRATPNNPVGLYTCAGLGNTGAADKGINWPLVNVTTTP